MAAVVEALLARAGCGGGASERTRRCGLRRAAAVGVRREGAVARATRRVRTPDGACRAALSDTSPLIVPKDVPADEANVLDDRNEWARHDGTARRSLRRVDDLTLRRGAGAVHADDLLALCTEAPSWTVLRARRQLEREGGAATNEARALVSRERMARAVAASAVVVALYAPAPAGSISSRAVPGQRLVAAARATSDGALVGEIVDMAVTSAWRGQGVGRLLVEEVTQAFLDMGISDVGATAPPEAQHFLQACGFRPDYRGCTTLVLGADRARSLEEGEGHAHAQGGEGARQDACASDASSYRGLVLTPALTQLRAQGAPATSSLESMAADTFEVVRPSRN